MKCLTRHNCNCKKLIGGWPVDSIDGTARCMLLSENGSFISRLSVTCCGSVSSHWGGMFSNGLNNWKTCIHLGMCIFTINDKIICNMKAETSSTHYAISSYIYSFLPGLFSPHSCPGSVLRINHFTFLLIIWIEWITSFFYPRVFVRPCVHFVHNLVYMLCKSVTYSQAKKYYIVINCLASCSGNKIIDIIIKSRFLWYLC